MWQKTKDIFLITSFFGNDIIHIMAHIAFDIHKKLADVF